MPTLAFACLVPLLIALSAPGAGSFRFPDSPLGRHALAYFEAYAAGDSAATGAFARAHVAAASLARTPMDERVRRMREIRGDHGALTPLTVVNDDTSELVVRVRDAHGELFDLGFLGEPGPPNLLTGIRWESALDEPGAPGGGGPMSEAEATNAIRDEVARRAREQDFSGVVLLARGNRRLLAEAHGLADRARKLPVTIDTRFNFASIGKLFTKVAIAQLAQAGRIALADPVTKYVPQFRVEHAGDITLAQLVEHRGGVDDVLRYAQGGDVGRGLVDVPSWLHLILEKPLLFEPGTAQRYSNGGYVLLGAVVQYAGGEDYYDYVRRHVLEPSGMTRTAWDRMHEASPPRAMGYTRGMHGAEGGRKPAPGLLAARGPVADRWPERGSPAGGGYTSATDLWRFAEALRARRLVSGAWTAWVLGGPEPGHGVAPDTSFTDVGMGIAGGSPGTNGVLEMAGAYDLVVLTNDDPPGAEELVRAIRAILRRVRS